MTQTLNRQIVLANRPKGSPVPENFRLEQTAIPTPSEGEVLLRSVYLSLDPYMRGRMNEGKSYADPVELNDVMVGGTVCQVVESKNSDFQTGEWVVAYTGWQDYALSNGEGLFKLGSERRIRLMPLVYLVCLALPLMWVYWKLVSLKLAIP